MSKLHSGVNLLKEIKKEGLHDISKRQQIEICLYLKFYPTEICTRICYTKIFLPFFCKNNFHFHSYIGGFT